MEARRRKLDTSALQVGLADMWQGLWAYWAGVQCVAEPQTAQRTLVSAPCWPVYPSHHQSPCAGASSTLLAKGILSKYQSPCAGASSTLLAKSNLSNQALLQPLPYC